MKITAIEKAQERQACRAAKRQRDYDRCIANGIPVTSEEHKKRMACFQQPYRGRTEMRYCGGKKKLQGELALVRYFNGHGIVEAQFNNLELTWRGTRLAFNWHRFQASEFEAL